jgi:hypothetical protein
MKNSLKRRRNCKKTRKGGKSKYGNKISPDEINKCNNMCNTVYMKKLKAKTVKDFNKYSLLKKQNKSKSEIEETIEKNRENHVTDCKNTFCNPKCSNYFNRKEKIRYFCPLCKKSEERVKKLGAITFCQHTDTL